MLVVDIMMDKNIHILKGEGLGTRQVHAFKLMKMHDAASSSNFSPNLPAIFHGSTNRTKTSCAEHQNNCFNFSDSSKLTSECFDAAFGCAFLLASPVVVVVPMVTRVVCCVLQNHFCRFLQ